LKHRGEYWCYSTGFWKEGRCFGVLHSTNLINWRELAGAMEPLPGGATCYWAPEVTYDNGRFYMYYSVGNEEFMEIRVAVAEDPAGPFIDSGRRLTTEQFAIDPHVFQNADGARYMFYATDFLEHTHIGTGTVMDRMIDLFTLAGRPRPVTRARFDWQVYDPHRIEKGGVRWHTVEGPFVLARKGLYYQMFSGGNWKNMTYGVSYAVTDDLETEAEWEQASDGELVLPILRTIRGSVLGPGHNSVVRGPDNQELFCVYHRWDEQSQARVLCIDRQDWEGDRLIVLGPSTSPQPAPLQPAVSGFDGGAWERTEGAWSAEGSALQTTASGYAEAQCKVDVSCFVAEVSLRSLSSKNGLIGASVIADGGDALRFAIVVSERKALLSRRTDMETEERGFDLPDEFAADEYHLLRIEVDGSFASISLDGATVRWSGRVDARAAGVALFAREAGGAFAGFALTAGWQDLFVREGLDAAETGWEITEGEPRWSIKDGRLCYLMEGDQAKGESEPGVIAKGEAFESYELIVNARLVDYSGKGGYGFYPAMGADGSGPLYTVERASDGWSLLRYDPSLTLSVQMPADFDPFSFQQFRFRKERGRLSVSLRAHMIDEIDISTGAARPGIYSRSAALEIDMVRVTAITDKIRGETG
ncbi:MAG TPA: glycoside hydrolase family 43 protein, partial [Blastocatellia bacterium]|nr:glycoside hydrolase family 43 protein [Blastocatellia bacterium]